MHLYKEINPVVASTVLKGMTRHLQYLSPENAIFALADDSIDNETRSSMAIKILNVFKSNRNDTLYNYTTKIYPKQS